MTKKSNVDETPTSSRQNDPIRETVTETVTVSAVVGDGDDARRIVRFGSWSFVAWEQSKDEPRIRDIDLAERLGYERPEAIRDLIKRLIRDGKLNDNEVFRVVRKTSELGGRPPTEFWLTEAQALKVIAKSEAAMADPILDDMIRVYMAVRRGLIGPGESVGMRELVTTVATLSKTVEALAQKIDAGSTGSIAPADLREIEKEIAVLCKYRVFLGKHDHVETERGKLSSARGVIQQRIAAISHWAGTGTKRKLMPSDKVPHVKAELNRIWRDLDEARKERGVPESAWRDYQVGQRGLFDLAQNVIDINKLKKSG